MKRVVVLFALIFSSVLSFSQTTIHMEKVGGVYKVPCEVNGLRLKFIFDTGASDVSISRYQAEMMLENDYIKESDIIGASKYQIADGTYVDATVIVLREIRIGGIVLRNVRASVAGNADTPLLLGQSALRKLGQYSIIGNDLILAAGSSKRKYSEEEIQEYLKKIDDAFSGGISLSMGLSYSQQLYDDGVLPLTYYPTHAELLYTVTKDYNQAFSILSSIEKEWNTKFSNNKHEMWAFYYRYGEATNGVGNNPILYYEKAIRYASDLDEEILATTGIVQYYYRTEDSDYSAFTTAFRLYKRIANERGYKKGDCWTKGVLDSQLGHILTVVAEANSIEKQRNDIMREAAKLGDEYAKAYCWSHNLSYQNKPADY